MHSCATNKAAWYDIRTSCRGCHRACLPCSNVPHNSINTGFDDTRKDTTTRKHPHPQTYGNHGALTSAHTWRSPPAETSSCPASCSPSPAPWPPWTQGCGCARTSFFNTRRRDDEPRWRRDREPPLVCLRPLPPPLAPDT